MAMYIPDYIVLFILTYYTVYAIKMVLSTRLRTGKIEVNKQLDKLRRIPQKTIEEQKQFLSLKYPKAQKRKWTFKRVFGIIIYAGIFIGFIKAYAYLLTLSGFSFKIWQAVLFVIVGPMILNYLMEKFGFQKSDLSVYFKGWRKK